MGKKILLADDSITIQKVIELTFSDEDFEVSTVGNGRLAIEKIQEVRPDIILCDIIMPEKDGYEVCEWTRKNPAFAQVPVLLLTGAFEPFDQERANRVGCDGFLAKPFEPQTLIAKVKDLLSKARSTPAATAAPAAPRAPEAVTAPRPQVSAPPPPVAPSPISQSSIENAATLPRLTVSQLEVEEPPFMVDESPAPAAVSQLEVEESPFMVDESPAPAAAPAPVEEDYPPTLADAGYIPEEPFAGVDPSAFETVELTPEGMAAPAAETASEEAPALYGGDNDAFETSAEVPATISTASMAMPADETELVREETFEAPEEFAEFGTEPMELTPEPPPVAPAEELGPRATERSRTTSWSQPTVEMTWEARAQAGIDSAQMLDTPVFEEVFDVDSNSASGAPPFRSVDIPMPKVAPEDLAEEAEMPPAPPPAKAEPAVKPSSPPLIQPPALMPVVFETPPHVSFADIAPKAVEPAAAAAPSHAAGVAVPVDMVAQIAQRVVGQISEQVIREIAWEVIPELAEALIKKEIERLKAEAKME